MDCFLTALALLFTHHNTKCMHSHSSLGCAIIGQFSHLGSIMLLWAVWLWGSELNADCGELLMQEKGVGLGAAPQQASLTLL